MAANSRESRRRKILERGSDRLALIAGRIPPSYPSQIHREHQTASLQPLISPEADLSDQTSVSPDGENKVGNDVSDSTLLKYDPALDAGRTSANQNGNSVESLLPELLPECGTSIEVLEIPASEVKDEVHYSLVSSTDQTTSVSTSNKEQQMEPQRCQCRLFTLSKICSAISATERARLFCSIVVAFLVVLSDLGFPLPGSTIIKSILSFRPLYLILLTNLSIVLAQLLLDDQGGFRRTTREENNIPSTDAYGWAEQASKVLEVGLLMQKVIDTVFMNCGIYSIIVICGLSFG